MGVSTTLTGGRVHHGAWRGGEGRDLGLTHKTFHLLMNVSILMILKERSSFLTKNLRSASGAALSFALTPALQTPR